MAASKITYDDKVGTIPKDVHINQVWDDDMNEIKLKVNNNADLLDDVEEATDINTLDIAEIQTTLQTLTLLNSEKGWGHYVDGASSSETITTTPTKLMIDGLGATNNTQYLPFEIRGTSQLWNTTTNKIIPISLGDSYDIRIDITIITKTLNPNTLDLVLDIGTDTTITNPVVTRSMSISKTPPFTLSIGFPIFCLSTFLANGGQIFLSTDTGSLEISTRNIMIKRDYKGQL